MSDTTHPPLLPLGEVPEVPDRPAAKSKPALVNGPSDLPAPPEDILEEWRWIMKGREEGIFDAYAGKHVAVHQRKIWGGGLDAELLREFVALKYHIDPERLVIVYIDHC